MLWTLCLQRGNNGALYGYYFTRKQPGSVVTILALIFHYINQLNTITMANKLRSQTAIVIDAPVTAVWQALTTPDIIRKYFHGTEAVSEWTVGNSILFKGEWEGHDYQGRGIILNRVPYKLFKFSYWSSLSGLENKSENYIHVTYEMWEEENGRTELTVILDKIQNEKMKGQLEQNLFKILKNLKWVVETQTEMAA